MPLIVAIFILLLSTLGFPGSAAEATQESLIDDDQSQQIELDNTRQEEQSNLSLEALKQDIIDTFFYQNPLDFSQQQSDLPYLIDAPLIVIERPRPPVPPVQGATVDAPDERVLWKLLDNNQFGLLSTQIQQFKAQYPHWSPPQQLLFWSRQKQSSKLIKQLIRDNDSPGLIAAAATYPDYFDCQHMDASWRLAQAYAQTGQGDKATTQYQQILSQCDDEEIQFTTLQKASKQISAVAYEQMLLDYSNSLAAGRSQQLNYEYEKTTFLALEAPRPLPGALLKSLILEMKDEQMAEYTGWLYRESGNISQALAWFETALQWNTSSEDATLGAILCLIDLGDRAGALKLARPYQSSNAKIAPLARQLYLDASWKAFAEKDYEQAKVYLEQRLALGKTSIETDTLSAWIAYHTGDFEQAGSLFRALYQQQPEEGIGAALVNSYIQQGKDPSELALQFDGPILKQIAAYQARQFYADKRFALAYKTSRTALPQLLNIDSPTLEMAAIYQHKSGDAGRSQLDTTFLPLIKASYSHNIINRFSLTLAKLKLDSGSQSLCAPFGSLPVDLGCSTDRLAVSIVPNEVSAITTLFLPTQRPPFALNNLKLVQFDYLYEGPLSWFASIGTTPIDAPVSTALTFQLGFKKRWGSDYLETNIHSLPVRESILSYAGSIDPFTNQSWGRVKASGVRAKGYRTLTDHWGLYAEGGFDLYDGKQVADNWSLDFSIHSGYNFSRPGWDYLSVGPSISLKHFDKNLSHFTLGHGGYFSPNYFINPGLGINFLTQEEQRFIVKGRLAAGIQFIKTDSAPWFPNNDYGLQAPVDIRLNGNLINQTSPSYSGDNSSGIGGDLEVKAAWLVHPNWTIGGGLSLSTSGGYDEYAVGAFVRFNFKPRAALFSTDLPDYLFNLLP